MLNASHFDLSFICLCLHTYVQCSYIIVDTRFAVENRKANELLTTLFHEFSKSRSKICLIKVHTYIQRRPQKIEKIFQFVLTLQIIFKKVGDFLKVFGLLRMYEL